MGVFLKGKFRRYLLVIIDFISICVSCVFAAFCFEVLDLEKLVLPDYIPDIAAYAFLSVAFMYFFRVYKIIWRYARLRDFLSCLAGVFSSTLLAAFISGRFMPARLRMYYVFCGMLSLSVICVLRISYGFLYYYTTSHEKNAIKNNVMIIGAGQGGHHLCELMQSGDKYTPTVFIDDDSNKTGRVICGVPVKGNTNEIPKIVNDMNIGEIILAIPSIDSVNKKRILNICSETLCKVSVLPGLDEYIHTDSPVKQMKSVKIEDLLGRDVVSLDNENTVRMVKDKVCMVTGGGGSIGSELVRQVARMKPQKLVIVDIYENNAYNIEQELIFTYGKELDLSIQIASVRDNDKMERLFSEFKPDIVFHAAAHKHVPLMETNPEEAVKNNIFGTLNTAMLAKKYNAKKFVLVSTDKAVNPTNIMGATKRCCEMIVECMAQSKSNTEFVAVRFGNVLGSNGSVIPLFEKQISHGGPVTVTDPQIIRYFMTIPEAAALILQAATLASGGEIFVLDMGEPVKILKLAEDLIKLHGFRPYKDIDIVFTGLRPGEKLFEELLMDEEGLQNTANNKIFIGHQIQVDEKVFMENMERLHNAANENDKQECERILHEIVPTFKRKKQPATKIV